jgi:hypothetical protein
LDKNEGSHGEYLEEWREVEIHGEIPPIRRDLRGRRVGGERDTGGELGLEEEEVGWGRRLPAGGPAT